MLRNEIQVQTSNETYQELVSTVVLWHTGCVGDRWVVLGSHTKAKHEP